MENNYLNVCWKLRQNEKNSIALVGTHKHIAKIRVVCINVQY